MSLACGGRGPCCHLGYAHRHCEHCDEAIALACQHPHYFGGWIPNWAGYYPRPYQPYYGNGGGIGLASQGSSFSQLNNSLQGLQSSIVPIEHQHEP